MEIKDSRVCGLIEVNIEEKLPDRGSIWLDRKKPNPCRNRYDSSDDRIAAAVVNKYPDRQKKKRLMEMLNRYSEKPVNHPKKRYQVVFNDALVSLRSIRIPVYL